MIKLVKVKSFLELKQFQKQYDVCISLGFNCFTSMSLRDCLLQNLSYPFDWSRGVDEEKAGILGLEGKVDLLCSDFKDWMNREDFIHIDDDPLGEKPHLNVRNVRTGLQYIHDFPKSSSLEKEFPNFQEKYLRRKHRLIETINTKKCCFVFYAGLKFINDDLIIRLFKKIRQRYPLVQLDLLLVQNNPYITDGIFFLEDLNENIRKVSFNNGAFEELVQANGDLISPKLRDIFSVLLKINDGVIFYPDDLCGASNTNTTPDYSGNLTYGPYISLKKGTYDIAVLYELTENYRAYVDVVADFGKTYIHKVDLPPKRNKFNFNVSLDRDFNNLEIRSFCHPIEPVDTKNRFTIRSVSVCKK